MSSLNIRFLSFYSCQLHVSLSGLNYCFIWKIMYLHVVYIYMRQSWKQLGCIHKTCLYFVQLMPLTVCFCLHFGIVDHAEFKSFNLLLLTCLRTYKLLYSCLTSKGGMTSQNDARGNRLLSQQKIRILK